MTLDKDHYKGKGPKQVFKRVECESPSCKRTFLILCEQEYVDSGDKAPPITIVCGTSKPNCKRNYEKSLVEEIEVVE